MMVQMITMTIVRQPEKKCLGQSPQMDVQRNKELCLQVANLEITRHQSANATTKDGTECTC